MKDEKAHLFLAIEADCNAGVAALSRLLSVFGDAEAGWNDGVARLLNVNNPRFGDQLGFCRGENSSDENRFLAGTKSRLMLLLFSSFFFLLIALFLGFFFVQFPVLSSVFLGKFWVSLSFLSGFFPPPGVVNCWVFIGINPPLPQPHVSPLDKHD